MARWLPIMTAHGRAPCVASSSSIVSTACRPHHCRGQRHGGRRRRWTAQRVRHGSCGAGGRIGYPEMKVGIQSAMALLHLMRLVGERQARYLALTGELISAMRAREMGLINEGVPKDELMATALQWARLVAMNEPKAEALSKTLLRKFSRAPPACSCRIFSAHRKAVSHKAGCRPAAASAPHAGSILPPDTGRTGRPSPGRVRTSVMNAAGSAFTCVRRCE